MQKSQLAQITLEAPLASTTSIGRGVTKREEDDGEKEEDGEEEEEADLRGDDEDDADAPADVVFSPVILTALSFEFNRAFLCDIGSPDEVPSSSTAPSLAATPPSTAASAAVDEAKNRSPSDFVLFLN